MPVTRVTCNCVRSLFHSIIHSIVPFHIPFQRLETPAIFSYFLLSCWVCVVFFWLNGLRSSCCACHLWIICTTGDSGLLWGLYIHFCVCIWVALLVLLFIHWLHWVISYSYNCNPVVLSGNTAPASCAPCCYTVLREQHSILDMHSTVTHVMRATYRSSVMNHLLALMEVPYCNFEVHLQWLLVLSVV